MLYEAHVIYVIICNLSLLNLTKRTIIWWFFITMLFSWCSFKGPVLISSFALQISIYRPCYILKILDYLWFKSYCFAVAIQIPCDAEHSFKIRELFANKIEWVYGTVHRTDGSVLRFNIFIFEILTVDPNCSI